MQLLLVFAVGLIYYIANVNCDVSYYKCNVTKMSSEYEFMAVRMAFDDLIVKTTELKRSTFQRVKDVKVWARSVCSRTYECDGCIKVITDAAFSLCHNATGGQISRSGFVDKCELRYEMYDFL